MHAPFSLDGVTHSIHKTYLDSTGRPKVTLTKRGCTERHEQLIYVRYCPYQPRLLIATPLIREHAPRTGHLHLPSLCDPAKATRHRGRLGRALCRRGRPPAGRHKAVSDRRREKGLRPEDRALRAL